MDTLSQRRIAIIGAPLDLGQNRPGVDMGPAALRYPDRDKSLLRELQKLGHTVEDLGDVDVAHRGKLPEPHPAEKAKYLPQIVAASARLGAVVQQAAREGKTPLVMGGDHSVAIGTVAGVSSHFRDQGKKIGLIWVDAHADMNTPEITGSGNIHGMPLACCIGQGPQQLACLLGYAPKIDPRNVALVGLRDVDEEEKQQVLSSKVAAFTMRDLDEQGVRAITAHAIAAACDGTDGFHLSLDMDFLDPSEAPGVGTPVSGGATFREAHLLMELIYDCGRLISLEVVEVNPVLDERNRTAKLALHLVLSAMGKRILL